ncbi:MAG: DUF4349 domain-containing protein [Gemmatimonadota bacterium]
MRFRAPLLVFVLFSAAACRAKRISELPQKTVTTAQGLVSDRAPAPMGSGFAAEAAPADAIGGGQSAVDPTSNIASDPTVLPTMIIRNGQASVEIDSLDAGVAAVRALAARLGGYIANTNVSAGHDQLHAALLEVKIPAARFDEAVSGLRPIGRVESVNVTAEDVGEEYTDVQARVSNAHRLEERLIELLATRTGKLQEVLSVERELARVREEIERYEGRLRFLRTRAAISTLAITVHEPPPLLQRPGSTPIADAFHRAWDNFVNLNVALIASLGTLLPLAVLGLGGWMIVRKAWRRRTA